MNNEDKAMLIYTFAPFIPIAMCIPALILSVLAGLPMVSTLAHVSSVAVLSSPYAYRLHKKYERYALWAIMNMWWDIA